MASKLERTAELGLIAAGVPEWHRHYKWLMPERKWEFDFAWPDWYVALECEGGVFMKPTRDGQKRGAHASVGGLLRDIEKYSRAAVIGWCVIRVAAPQVRKGDHVRWVEDAIQRRVRAWS